MKNIAPKSVQFQEKPNVAFDAPRTSSATASASHARVLHPNVICDACDKSIFGYRYKCLECADFDLCMDCEPKAHNHHLMIRICDPNDAEICYRSKLGKRFLRHRRSESLCTKLDEKEKEKDKRHHHGHHQHKRHASSASAVRPPTFSDVLCSVLKSYAAGPNEASASTKPTQPGGADSSKNQSAKVGAEASTSTATAGNANEGRKASSAPNTNATQTPVNPPPYGFSFPGVSPNEKCVPLKHGIDMLSHVAQNFAAMMDPFATFMEQQTAEAYASATPRSTPQSTTTATTPTTAQAAAAATANVVESAATAAAQAATAAMKAAEQAAKMAVEATVTANKGNTDDTEPLLLIEDISDDDDEVQMADNVNVNVIEDLRKSLHSSMNMSHESSGDSATSVIQTDAGKKDERSGSMETDKGML